MRITILSCGSRGDVQPYVALGKGLKFAGHDVVLVTHASFKSFVEENGLAFLPLSGDPKTMLESPDGRRLIEHGDSPAKFFRLYAKVAGLHMDEIVRDAYAACLETDVILCTTNIFFVGEMIAEKLKKPLIYASLVPFAPSWQQPGMGQKKLPWWAAWLLVPFRHYHTMGMIGMQVFAGFFREQCNRARQRILGLPPRSRWISPKLFRNGPPFLYNYSRHVYRRPSDWADTQHVTGYWFLDRPADWTPSRKLVDFLQAGPPPVCVGFGSMTPQSPDELARLVVRAIRQTGERGIVLSGWGGLSPEEIGDDMFIIDAVPHDWLFPQVRAVVHHGGSGTTAAGFRAGKPTVVVPFLGDQPFWGARVEELGVGPRPIPKRKLTVDTLAQAVRIAVHDSDMRRRAETLGAKIRAENGVQTAIDVIERELDRWFGTNRTERIESLRVPFSASV